MASQVEQEDQQDRKRLKNLEFKDKERMQGEAAGLYLLRQAEFKMLRLLVISWLSAMLFIVLVSGITHIEFRCPLAPTIGALALVVGFPLFEFAISRAKKYCPSFFPEKCLVWSKASSFCLALLTVLFCLISKIEFKFSDPVIIALVTTTTAAVISLFAIAAKWLFPPPPPDNKKNKSEKDKKKASSKPA